MNRRGLAALSVVVLVVLFFAINILADSLFRSVRVDLTENSLYTLTQGTRNILRDIEEPIRLRLYYSSELAQGTGLEPYGKRVEELLREYALASQGKIDLEVIEPEPDSEAEDEAVAFGLAGLTAPGGRGTIYLGLVGTNSTDGREIIRFFDPSPSEQRFLEYNVTKLIYTLANPEKPVLGVLSALALDGAPPNQFTGQPGQRPWRILAELRQLYDVRVLDPSAPEIEDDVSLLFVVHPKGFSDAVLYAIDQFVLGGGRLVAFVDPQCEADLPPNAAQDPFAVMNYPRASDLGPLFETWGVELAPQQIAADVPSAMSVNVGGRPVPYVAFLMLDEERLSEDDAITGQLSNIIMATAGVLDHAEDAPTRFTPLVTTTEESMRLGAEELGPFPQPQELLSDFVPGGRELVLAARVSGEVASAYPGGPPDAETPPDGEAPMLPEGHLAESQGEINVVIAADVDMITDRFWVDEMRLGQTVLGYRKLSDNGDFAINAVDNLAGSTDLISIRARGTYARPFTLVQEIQRDAEATYLAEEQRIDEEIRETERRINERGFATGEQGQIVLTAEQEAELESLQAQLAEAKTKKREIRYNLRKDVEQLGTTLKVINIGVVPAIVALVAVGLGAYRYSIRTGRRAAKARAG